MKSKSKITSKGHMLPLSELKNSKRKIGQNFISEPYIQSGLFIMYWSRTKTFISINESFAIDSNELIGSISKKNYKMCPKWFSVLKRILCCSSWSKKMGLYSSWSRRCPHLPLLSSEHTSDWFYLLTLFLFDPLVKLADNH